MGNYTSKLFYNSNDDMITKIQSEPFVSFEKSHNCTPIMFRRKLQIDPRSVTVGILRTPIEVNYISRKSNRNAKVIKKSLQSNQINKTYLETNFDINIIQVNNEQHLTPRTLSPIEPRTSNLRQNMIESDVANINVWNMSNSEVLHQKQSNVNDIDPRSPANDFKRTPILKFRATDQLILSQENLMKMKENNSNLDIRIRLSYCESTSPFKISEIQTLPDIVVNLKRSCSLQENINCLNLSMPNENGTKKSNLIPINAVNSYQINTKSNFNQISKINTSYKNIETVNKNEYSQINHNNPNCKELRNIFKTVDNLKKSLDMEENFVIWTDNYSGIYSNTTKSNYLIENSKILSKKQDILFTLDDELIKTIKKKSFNKKIEKSIEFKKEIKYAKLDKKIKQNMKKENEIVQNKFSPMYKYATEISRNRTPLGNRSNSNRKNEEKKLHSSQQLQSNCFTINDFQENSPLSNNFNSKLIKTIPSNFDRAQWDTDSTVII